MKTILVPTDFSIAAKMAFIYALRFADRLNAELLLLNVYQLPEPKGARVHFTLDQIHKEMEAEKLAAFQASLHEMRRIAEETGLGHIQISNYLKRDDHVEKSILRVSEREEVDMIIMGTRGATGAKEIFVGSVAGEVMEHATVPVLAIPQFALFDGEINKIGLTTEFKEEEKKVLSKVIEFAAIFGAQIEVVNVDVHQSEQYLEAKSEWEKAYEHQDNLNFHVIDGDNVHEALSIFMSKHDIDVLAMLTHKRNFIQELFNFSDAKKMSYHSKVPILAIQAHSLK